MSNSLNPLAAVVDAKRTDRDRAQQRLQALTTLRDRLLQFQVQFNALHAEPFGDSRTQHEQQLSSQCNALATAEAFTTQPGAQPAAWVGSTLNPVIVQTQALVNALTSELRDLEVQRDALDAGAAARIAEGASAETAYGLERSKLQLKTTIITVLKWSAIVAGVALVLWGGWKLFKRINRG